MPNPRLVLIDGHSLAFRAFHALPPDMSAPNGELTNAAFGFTSMLLNVLRDQNPDYVLASFDLGKTFRHETYPAYKGHRERMPDELVHQVERIKQIVTTLNIPIFAVENYEADDVLSTLARQAELQGVDSLIVTGDRDMLQVVDEHITVLTSGRRFSDTILYTPPAVLEKYSLNPERLIDYKALIGDKSDNIPGVHGVGEKSAVTLLQRYDTLHNVYAHLAEITPARLQEALRTGEADAWLSQDLARIRLDAPVQLDLSACVTREFDREAIVKLFQHLAFRSLVDRLPKPLATQRKAAARPEPEPPAPAQLFDADFAIEPASAPAGEQMALFEAAEAPIPSGTPGHGLHLQGFVLVDSAERLAEVVAHLQRVPFFAFDTETTGLDPLDCELVGVSVAWGRSPEEAAYIPLKHPDAPLLSWAEVRTALQPAFDDPNITRAAHNAGYDLAVLGCAGLHVVGPIVDTMVAQWLEDPGIRSLGLKDLAFTRLNVEMTPIVELIGSGKKQITMDRVPVAQAAPYAAADALMTLRLADLLLPELEQRGLTPLFHDIEMPLTPVLVAMEAAGVQLDVPYLKTMSRELAIRQKDLEQNICQIAGFKFNVNSTQQLSDVLFGKLGLSSVGMKKTQAGSVSTAADVLETLKGQHEIVDLILEHRQLSKLLGTYVDALPALVNPRTGRLHTSFNQAGAETGRISSNTPNLQNIPVRSELGREIRRAFVAPGGYQLLSADYSQVELRILAHISQDETLLAAFGRGEDIHASAAALVYGVKLADVTKAQRGVAKMMNFATSYGVSAFGLSQRTGLSRSEADDFMKLYFSTYPGVKRYLDQTRAQARELGYVETLLGRRRFFPVLRTQASGSRAHMARQAAERAAINHPIQGTAADIIKIAMINLHHALRAGGYQARMLLQVHDELVLEVPTGELEAVSRLVADKMEGAYELDATLRVDMEAGPNWLEMTHLARS
jgi:DNA polymerase I